MAGVGCGKLCGYPTCMLFWLEPQRVGGIGIGNGPGVFFVLLKAVFKPQMLLGFPWELFSDTCSSTHPRGFISGCIAKKKHPLIQRDPEPPG